MLFRGDFMSCKKILTFSFDDGVTQDERFVEILNRYGLKCTFNINSGLLGTDGFLMIDGKKISHKKITPEMVREIYRGHEIAAHTLTHPNLTTLPPEKIVEQVEGDRLALSELAGYEVTGFAYPCGGINSNKAVADIIKNKTGVTFARNITNSFNFDLPRDLYLLRPTASLTKNKSKLLDLCEQFLKSQSETTQLFYIWGHSYELDIDNSWDYFESICKMLSGKDDIYYSTNTEALNYIKSI